MLLTMEAVHTITAIVTHAINFHPRHDFVKPFFASASSPSSSNQSTQSFVKKKKSSGFESYSSHRRRPPFRTSLPLLSPLSSIDAAKVFQMVQHLPALDCQSTALNNFGEEFFKVIKKVCSSGGLECIPQSAFVFFCFVFLCFFFFIIIIFFPFLSFFLLKFFFFYISYSSFLFLFFFFFNLSQCIEHNLIEHNYFNGPKRGGGAHSLGSLK